MASNANAWTKGAREVDATFAPTLPGDKKTPTYPLDTMAAAWAALASSDAAQSWLTSRGLTLQLAQQLSIGFAPSRNALVLPTINDGAITCLRYISIVDVDEKIAAPKMTPSVFNLGACVPGEDVFVCASEVEAMTLAQAGYRAVGYPFPDYVPSPAERDALMKARQIFLVSDSRAFRKLWNELRERTFLIDLPDGNRDVSDLLVKGCESDMEKFRALVEKLKITAMTRPLPNFYDLSRTMRNADGTLPTDNPARLHFRQKEIDEMAVILPGSVVGVYATYTGSGKTTWILDQFELDAVLKHGGIVLNYSAELSPQEFGALATANLLGKDRLSLTAEDFREAADMLDEPGAGKFYIGYNPSLSHIGQVLDVIDMAVRRLGATIVVLDHIHFLTRGEPDEIKAQSDAMQRIKNMAVARQIIFVVVGQSRKEPPTGQRRDRPSELSDMKGSEAVTSDASAVFCLHRAIRRDVDMSGDPSTWPDDVLDTVCDVKLVKCRSKGKGKSFVRQVFDGSIARFFPYTNQEQTF